MCTTCRWVCQPWDGCVAHSSSGGNCLNNFLSRLIILMNDCWFCLGEVQVHEDETQASHCSCCMCSGMEFSFCGAQCSLRLRFGSAHDSTASKENVAQPVLDLHFGLTSACAALTKQTIVGSSGSVGNSGSLSGSGMSGLLKSPSARSMDSSPTGRFSLSLIPICVFVAGRLQFLCSESQMAGPRI